MRSGVFFKTKFCGLPFIERISLNDFEYLYFVNSKNRNNITPHSL